MTGKQYLKLHPEKFLLVTREFGNPVYISKSYGVTDDKNDAEIWSSLDNNDTKIGYYTDVTKFTGLKFEQI